jgi:hypothetical protein
MRLARKAKLGSHGYYEIKNLKVRNRHLRGPICLAITGEESNSLWEHVTFEGHIDAVIHTIPEGGIIPVGSVLLLGDSHVENCRLTNVTIICTEDVAAKIRFSIHTPTFEEEEQPQGVIHSLPAIVPQP